MRRLALSPVHAGHDRPHQPFLHWAGVPLPVALSATLLFRGLSFWAPMLPGLLAARTVLRAEPPG